MKNLDAASEIYALMIDLAKITPPCHVEKIIDVYLEY